MDHTWAMEHYWEFYFFGGMGLILFVYLVAYVALDWLGEQQQRQSRLTNADEMYHLKGDDARPNSRRV